MPFEPSLLETFKENPLPFVVMLFFAGLGIVLGLIGVVFAMKKSKAALALGIVAAVLGLVTVVIGFGGRALGQRRAAFAAETPGLSAHDRARIVGEGAAEAGYSLTFGLGAGVLPLLVGIGGMVMARKK